MKTGVGWEGLEGDRIKGGLTKGHKEEGEDEEEMPGGPEAQVGPEEPPQTVEEEAIWGHNKG